MTRVWAEIALKAMGKSSPAGVSCAVANEYWLGAKVSVALQ